MVSVLVLAGPAIAVVIIVAYVTALRTRHHYTSVLACPKCGRNFTYKWVPMASFSAVRLATSRYLQCPLCKEWSTFDVWQTRTKGSAGNLPAETQAANGSPGQGNSV